MDKLQKTALAYQLVMQVQYYFEIAKKIQSVNLF